MAKFAALVVLGFPATLATAGCASGNPPCVTTGVLAPQNLTLDHTVAAPGNQTTYSIGTALVQGNCPIPLVIVLAKNITVSDPVNIQVDNSGPASIVKCVGATAGAATVTSGTLTAKLTCN